MKLVAALVLLVGAGCSKSKNEREIIVNTVEQHIMPNSGNDSIGSFIAEERFTIKNGKRFKWEYSFSSYPLSPGWKPHTIHVRIRVRSKDGTSNFDGGREIYNESKKAHNVDVEVP